MLKKLSLELAPESNHEVEMTPITILLVVIAFFSGMEGILTSGSLTSPWLLLTDCP